MAKFFLRLPWLLDKLSKQMNQTTLRHMQNNDLDSVLAIQAEAFAPFLHADRLAFEELLKFYPQGCWVSTLDQKIAGYMISHPSYFTDPPSLGEIPNAQSIQPDCYFINDVAIDQSFRGTGVACKFVEQAIELALEQKHIRMALISVQHSQGFWKQFGFKIAEISPDLKAKILQWYGQDACYMARDLK